ncbi:CopM family metallochaperone [Halomonas sp. BC04]|uniref:CopM family metallochaperone n=1 Tax=Halomonas sp. BC04 TaxID=1403540 RepID=UPI0003ED80BB|nr:DUF305 domain-containing protein [Halomonas sp. BC04]EWG99438.1 hypothetical protein Q427_24875 [Halomonas sp. BC04]
MTHIPAVRTHSSVVITLTGAALVAALLASPLVMAESPQEDHHDEAHHGVDGGPSHNHDHEGSEEGAENDEPAPADDHHGEHGAHGVDDEDDEHAENPAVQAYREVNDRMHQDMMIEFTGDADADFARGMIPHHQGAIDMANVVLVHGEDEAIRDLAREIIEAQEEEIAFLRDWLVQHGYETN